MFAAGLPFFYPSHRLSFLPTVSFLLSGFPSALITARDLIFTHLCMCACICVLLFFHYLIIYILIFVVGLELECVFVSLPLTSVFIQ